ncbi:MAG TPA: urate hydroxylase PuuD [Bacteroidota bacterium]|nr:urate hydroxylase PuuD [Bacteroidota bacterium]
MEITDILHVLFRWVHIVAGILWIGLLYWFNWVNTPLGGVLDADTKKKVLPEMLPRALYFFRFAALWTFVAGILLLGIVFYSGGLMFEQGTGGWGVASGVMVAVTFLIFGLYDQVARTSIGKNLRAMGAIGFVAIVVIEYLMINWAGFSYRAYNIHIGAMFGTIMVGNVWMRIWPAQKKIIPAIREGTAPDAALMAQAAQRSRHNTYLSVPLVWTMINSHTVVPGADSWLILPLVVLLGWGGVALLYAKSTKVKGL